MCGAAVAVAAAAGALWLTRSGGGNGDGAPGGPLRVLFTGETLGELEPCNCSGQMAGGLPLRAGYLAAQTGPYWLFDVGCVGTGARAFEQVRLAAALRGMALMGYDAVNVGQTELWLGAADLRETMKLGVPLVSLNVTDEAGAPFAFSHRIVEKGGRRVLVTGLVDDDYRPGPGLRVDDPREALGRALPGWMGGAEAIVVLADLPEPQVRDLAEQFPEIALILFRGRGDSLAPERVNRTIIASVYGHARYIGDLSLSTGADGRRLAAGQAVLLDDYAQSSEAVTAATIGWYKQAVRGRRFDPAEDRPGSDAVHVVHPPPGNGYAGSGACQACHSTIHQRWSVGPHAHAMKSLARAGYEWSPECVVCHVTGYGARQGGFVSVADTPAMAEVGCEACHGPALAHASDSTASLRPVSAQTCLTCHEARRDPSFEYESDWRKAGHGKSPQAEDAPPTELGRTPS